MTETVTAGAARPPKHLWVVGILTLLWNAVGAFDYLMTQTKNEAYMKAFTPEQLDYFYGFPAWVVACWATAVWGGVLGSLLLVLRRTQAVPVLAASLIAMVLTTIHNFLLSDGLRIMGAGAAAFSAVIFLIALGLVVYSRTMRARGVLR